MKILLESNPLFSLFLPYDSLMSHETTLTCSESSNSILHCESLLRDFKRLALILYVMILFKWWRQSTYLLYLVFWLNWWIMVVKAKSMQYLVESALFICLVGPPLQIALLQDAIFCKPWETMLLQNVLVTYSFSLFSNIMEIFGL